MGRPAAAGAAPGRRRGAPPAAPRAPRIHGAARPPQPAATRTTPAASRCRRAARGPRTRRRDTRYGADDEWQEWLDPGEGAQAGGPLPARGPAARSGRTRSGRCPSAARPRRRRASAGAVLVAMLLGFFVAGLLDAAAIEKRVQGRSSAPCAACSSPCSSPSSRVSGWLQLDRPAEALNAALGRGEEKHHTLAETRTQKKSHWPRAITAAKPLRL